MTIDAEIDDSWIIRTLCVLFWQHSTFAFVYIMNVSICFYDSLAPARWLSRFDLAFFQSISNAVCTQTCIHNDGTTHTFNGSLSL